jgi:ketosteroid isomerase-like protein
VQSGADGDFGFWTGFQDSEAKLEGKDKLVPMRLRVTELYSRRNGDWKLIHRHADPAA